MNTAEARFHDKKKALLFLLVIPVLVIPFLIQPEAEAGFRQQVDFIPKTIFNFEMPKGTTQGQVELMFVDVNSRFQTHANSKLKPSFDRDYKFELVDFFVYKVSGNTWQAYPKFILSGTWTDSPTIVTEKFEAYYLDVVNTYEGILKANGATNIDVDYHILVNDFKDEDRNEKR